MGGCSDCEQEKYTTTTPNLLFTEPFWRLFLPFHIESFSGRFLCCRWSEIVIAEWLYI